MIMSYEDTVLFLVSNFQYLTVAIAFSTAYPFRKPIYTNLPFFISVCLLLLSDTVLVFMPNPGFNQMPTQAAVVNGKLVTGGRNPVADFFLLYPFIGLIDNPPMQMIGQSFHYYRYQIMLGIICNSMITLAYESYFIKWLTDVFDKKGEVQKQKDFEARMLKPGQ